MKKTYIVLAVLLSFGIGKVIAEDVRNVPSSGNQSSIPADFAGVDIATNSFYVGLATVPSENGNQGIGYRKFFVSTTNVNGVYATSRWTIYGVNFSSGNCRDMDFVSVQVSSSSATQAREVTRFLNNNAVANSTGVVCGGATYLRWPIRVYGNLFWGVNQPSGAANPYNRADLLYYKEGE